ncbi:chloroplast ATP synthase subunit II [Dunaliella salina]|uniref:Chloroplast ATP synthase subunit II n=1 Tax=Dunaliella salina TaxID=3046 RepID=A0ABQ7G8A5_DUNSA|nr:chloroplast ATP synthase subunit II [Dunaliella salina]|eukprot:KAF5830843.1 chloroplast ATP synthase subunit II [Dunaliella salina]
MFSTPLTKMQALVCRSSQQVGLRAARPQCPALPRPNALRAVTVRAQKQEQPAALERAQLALMPVSLAVADLLMHPAMALAEEEKQPGRLFDFNLTLPAMMAQFLLLMVMLDKLWFSPVGRVLDERDALIRSKLAGVKGDSTDVDSFAVEAQEILKKARQEVTKMIQTQKNNKQSELDAQYNEAKGKISREVEASIAAVEKESQAMLARLDAQVDNISGEVLTRVLPDGVKV